jgi:hypothetical protein
MTMRADFSDGSKFAGVLGFTNLRIAIPSWRPFQRAADPTPPQGLSREEIVALFERDLKTAPARPARPLTVQEDDERALASRIRQALYS